MRCWTQNPCSNLVYPVPAHWDEKDEEEDDGDGVEEAGEEAADDALCDRVRGEDGRFEVKRDAGVVQGGAQGRRDVDLPHCKRDDL